MIIREEQFAALAAGWERFQRSELILRLRREVGHEIGAISDARLEKEVEDACKAAAVLQITDTKDLYRFLRLRYSTTSAWKRPSAQEMVVRVLTDTSIEPSRRLQFIERALLAISSP